MYQLWRMHNFQESILMTSHENPQYYSGPAFVIGYNTNWRRSRWSGENKACLNIEDFNVEVVCDTVYDLSLHRRGQTLVATGTNISFFIERPPQKKWQDKFVFWSRLKDYIRDKGLQLILFYWWFLYYLWLFVIICDSWFFLSGPYQSRFLDPVSM